MSLKITPVLFQTNKVKPEPYIIELIQQQLGDSWKYEFFSDEDSIAFFKANPVAELPNIIAKYNSIVKGAHKADLFRYYYLYLKGGFFMDSDAMLYENIQTIVNQYDFISVESSCVGETLFQGILGASLGNAIIKKALFNAYNTDLEMLEQNYAYWTRDIYAIVKNDTSGYNIKLLHEFRNDNNGDKIVDEFGRIVFKHYCQSKIIPMFKQLNYEIESTPMDPSTYLMSYMNGILPSKNTAPTDPTDSIPNDTYIATTWNNYNRNEINYFDYRVLTTYTIPNPLIRIGPKGDGGYIIADDFTYDLFISCGIGGDIQFEDEFLSRYPSLLCYAFDGTIDSIPPHKNTIIWIKKNIEYKNTDKTTNLKEYCKNVSKIFLKMDIKGSEFNWLDSMTKNELECFSQIVLEVHWPFDLYRNKMLEKLRDTHYIIHIHGNNYCDRDIPKHLPSGRTYDGTVHINNKMLPSIQLPEVFEVTYVNKKLFDNSSVTKKELHFPTEMDYPNNPWAKDICFSIPL